MGRQCRSRAIFVYNTFCMNYFQKKYSKMNSRSLQICRQNK